MQMHPDMEHRRMPTCLQVQRDPRLVDVRRVTLGPDPPDRSAVYLLLRGRRHVSASSSRGTVHWATGGDCERFGAAAAASHAPAPADGVGGRRTIVMEMEGKEGEEGEEEDGGWGGDTGIVLLKSILLLIQIHAMTNSALQPLDHQVVLVQGLHMSSSGPVTTLSYEPRNNVNLKIFSCFFFINKLNNNKVLE